MKTLNNEILIHRNETFSIDKIVQNKDGSPYIISNKLSNPYFLISISTTRYAQNNRYIKNYWLDLSKYPRFTSTNAVNLLDIKVSATSAVPIHSSFEDITYSGSGAPLIMGYVNNNIVSYDPDDAVFYIEDKNGNRVYKYYNTNTDSNGNYIGWSNYECRIVKAFTNEDTREWVEQSYVYSIQLVSGQSTLDFLQNICNDNSIDYSTETVLELYEKITSNGIDVPIDITRPLANFDTVSTILIPTKLSVLSSLQGGL